MNLSLKEYKNLLDLAQAYANGNSGCRKVSVGSVIIEEDQYKNKGYSILSYGANVSVPDICKSEECRRIQLYGEDSKNHRLPSDCRAVHSEISAIIEAKTDLAMLPTTIIVTRYPCEACARAIVMSGIRTVVYGRKQEISEETQNIFNSAGILVIHITDWDAEDTER